MKNIKNSRELSNLIDKYLIPQELEKKNNAEVSTPYSLRKDMLDKIPQEFWTKENTVFEEGMIIIKNKELFVAKQDLKTSESFDSGNWEAYKKHDYAKRKYTRTNGEHFSDY